MFVSGVFLSIGFDLFLFQARSLRSKYKDGLARNHINVSLVSKMSTLGLFYQQVMTIKVQLSVLVQYKANIISLNVDLFMIQLTNCSFGVKHSLYIWGIILILTLFLFKTQQQHVPLVRDISPQTHIKMLHFLCSFII